MKCPSCGGALESISLNANMLFVKGRRYVGARTWVTGCCSAEYMDDLLKWDSKCPCGAHEDEDEEYTCPRIVSTLTDLETGKILFSWKEGRVGE